MQFHADRWYWILIEAANKLLITGALQFVSPGSTTQVFAGVVISFVSLQAYQRGLPYTNKAVRQIGFSAAMVLFLFFFFALLVKAGVALTNNDTLFYGTIIGALSVAVFGVPAIIIAIRLYYKRPGEGLEEEEEEEDAEEEAKEEAVLAEEAAAPQAKGGPSGWEIFSKDVRWLRAQVADLPRRIVGGLTEAQKQEIRCEIQRAPSQRPARRVSVQSRGRTGAELPFFGCHHREAFEMFDSDHSGTIDVYELTEAMQCVPQLSGEATAGP